MKTKLLIPIIAGAAVTAALTWLFATDDGAETRENLTQAFNEKFPEVGEQLTSIKDRVIDGISGLRSKAEDVIS